MKWLGILLVVAFVASWTVFCNVAFSQALPTIIFDDSGVNVPVGVTVDDPGGSLQNLAIFSGFQPSGSPYLSGGPLVEYGRVTFTTPGNPLGFQPGGNLVAALQAQFSEPSNPAVISDALDLVAIGITGPAGGVTDTSWDVFYESDYLGSSPQAFGQLEEVIPETADFHTTIVGNIFEIQSRSNVPEPSTFILLGVGLAGAGLLRKRFKR